MATWNRPRNGSTHLATHHIYATATSATCNTLPQPRRQITAALRQPPQEKDEALADAIQQFKSQGVDLTNIDTSGTDRSAERDELAK